MKTIKIVLSTLCLLHAQAGHADWCDGRKFMVMAMPMSERVLKAGESLQQLQQSLTEEAGRLQLDIKQNSLSVKNALSVELNLLKRQTAGLCRQGQSGNFPLQYQGLPLADHLEFRAQILLNLNLLTAQQAASDDVDKMQEDIAQAVKVMQQKSRELKLLIKHHAVQVEMADKPGYNRQFLQAACMAAEASEDMLSSLKTVSLDTLLAKKIQQLREQKSTDDMKLERFLATCRYPDEPETLADWLNGLLNRIKSWR